MRYIGGYLKTKLLGNLLVAAKKEKRFFVEFSYDDVAVHDGDEGTFYRYDSEDGESADRYLSMCMNQAASECCGVVALGHFNGEGVVPRTATLELIERCIAKFNKDKFGVIMVTTVKGDFPNLDYALKKCKFKRIKQFVNPKTNNTINLYHYYFKETK